MTTVVVSLAILIDVKGDKIMDKLRLKVSFVSNILSSLIVTLNVLLIFPGRNVIFRNVNRKSSPSM